MPPKPERNAYDVLNLPRTASQEEIKKRYRELARQYHPDVNQGDPSASKKFGDVTTAYKTLSDPQSRATHDAELTLRERQAAQAAARSNGGAAPRSAPTSPGRPVATTPPPRGGATPASNAIGESQRITLDAQAAFTRGKLVEARSLAEQAVRLNQRNVAAYEVLGDVYRLQGKADEALNMYTMVLQLDPRNQTVRQRFERLARVTGSSPSPTAQRVFFDNRGVGSNPTYNPRPGPVNGRSAYPNPPVSGLHDEKRSLGLFAVGFIGYASVLMLILYTALFHGNAPMGTPMLGFISTWNGTIWTVLVLCGLLLGATMTITGTISRIDDELILSRSEGRGPHLPVGLLVIVVSFLSFYLGAVLYTVSAVIQEAFTRSMQRVFAAVLLVTGLLAAAYEPGHLQVLLWGSNVVFLSLVAGWLLGDFFRPEGS
jgi:curved DNA-binding protein CbpA